LEALEVWQGLGTGALVEAPCSTGAVAGSELGGATQVAVEFAAHEMISAPETLLPALEVMRHLPWLLQQAPRKTLEVLKVRDAVLLPNFMSKLMRLGLLEAVEAGAA
jgi:hypothetical protein